MQLDDLVFKVDTSDLDRANKLMQELGVSIQTLDKKIDASASKQSLIEGRQARAAKDTAKARLDNAKAIEAETKTEERKQKALEKTTTASEKAEKVTRKQAEAVDQAAKFTQRLVDTNEYLLQGFSRGESKQLANLKALKASTDQTEEYIKQLGVMSKLVRDPFDDSASGASKLTKELTVLKDMYRMVNADLDLTAKQMREVTNDKLRAIEVAKAESKSIFSVRDALREYNAENIKKANLVNQYAQVEKASTQAMKEAASATRQVTQEDERMAAALNTVNSALSKTATDSMVKYEMNLRKMGLSQEEYTKKLATYKAQLAQVQAQEEQRSQQHLARALSPQLTDIAVSLYSGQAPLTVLLQQGGQIADLFRLSGVEAQNFGKAMKDAFSSMIPVMATVVTGMGQFVKSLVVDGARGVVQFTANVTGLATVTDMVSTRLMTMGKAGEFAARGIAMIASATAILAATGLAVAAAALVGLAVGFKKVMDEQDGLAKSLAMSGASLGLTHNAAIQYAKSLDSASVSTGAAIKVMTTMAGTGSFVASEIDLVTKAAVGLQAYGGVAVEDTVKSFEKMKEKPVEALTELASKTGMVTAETVKAVAELYKQGQAADASAIAMKALADVNAEQVDRMKQNYSGFANVVIGLGSTIRNFFSDVFKTVWYGPDLKKQIADYEKDVAQLQARVNNGGNQIDTRNLNNALKKLQELQAQLNDAEVKASSEEAAAKQAKIAAANVNLNEKLSDSYDKLTKKKLTLSQYTEKYIADQKKAFALDQGMNASEVKFNDQQIKQMTEIAALEHKKMQGKPKADPSVKQAAKDLEVYTDLLNVSDGLTAKYNNTLEALQRRREQGKISEEAYISAVEKLIQMQPFAIKQAEELAKAQELEAKLLDRVNGKGADYTKTLKQIEDASKFMLNGKLYFSPEDIQAMKDNLEKLTPEYKQQEKALRASKKTMEELAIAEDKLLQTRKELAQAATINAMSTQMGKVQALIYQEENMLLDSQLKLREQIKNIEANKDLSAKDKELAKEQAINNELQNQVNIREQSEQAYQNYIDSVIGTTDDVLGRLQSLASASGNISFANAVSSAGELLKVMDQMNANQNVFAIQRQKAAGNEEELLKISQKEHQANVKSYADMTKGLKGFFKEGSTGYKALNAAEKAFRVYEAAMAIKNTLLKITQETAVTQARLAGDQTATTSAITSSATIVAAKQAEATASATAAVANQGNGDPYTAFARIAAMMAIMAGIGLMVGNGASTSVPTGDGKMAYATGKGTVFGDKDATTESIKNSLAILEDVDTLTMHYSYEMLKSLRSIDRAVSGITNLVLRSGGIEASGAGIMEGYQISSLGKIEDSLLNPLGIGALTSVMSKIFGTKTTITGQGIYINDASYQQIQDQQIDAGYYTDVRKKKKFLGFTTSDKSSTIYKEDKELSAQFAKILDSFVDSLFAAGEILGVSGDEIDDRLKDFVLKIGKIDLKDLKGEEINEKLLAVFGAAGDDLAKEALPGFEKFQQAGEGYLETVVRVAFTTDSVRASLDSLNRTLSISVDDAIALTEAFGGLDKYTEQTQAYLKDYYSAQEQNEIMQRQLTEAFKKQNMVLPTSKEEYRKLVEAQDLSTEAGREMYAFLISLAPAFAMVADEADRAEKEAKELADQIAGMKFDLDNRLLRATGREQEALNRERQKELKALYELDPALAKLQQEVWLAEDASKAAADAESARAKALQESERARQQAISMAMQGLQKAVAEEKKALQERIASTQETINTLKSLFDLLNNSVKTLYNQVDATAKMSYATARNVIASAVSTVNAGGSITTVNGLDVAINDAMSGLNADDYSTKVEYDRERLRLADELNTLKGTAKRELTTAEKQLEAINAEIKRLDQILEYWQMQIDIANGTYVAVGSVETAVKNLQNALEGIFTSSPGGSGTSGGKGPSLGGGPSGVTKDPATGKYYKDSYWGGTSWSSDLVTSEKETDRLDKLADIVRPTMGTGNVADLFNAAASAGYSLRDLQSVGRYLMPELAGATLEDYIRVAKDLGIDIKAYADGGKYRGGLALVGEEGPELINFSNAGHVSTASQTSDILAGSASRMVILERAVVSLSKGLEDVAKNTKRCADILTNVTPNGDGVTTYKAEEN